MIAAVSTHPGEETAMVDAHRRLKHTFAGLVTIDRAAAPGARPRNRRDRQGRWPHSRVAFARTSARTRITEIYVADTVGELGLIYRLAPIVFIGGSLVGHGGQNPIEAVKLGAALLHGPNVWNFAEIYAALDAAGGAEQVTDASKLAVRMGVWLKDANARETVARTALKALDTLVGALDRTLTAIDPYLMEFRLQRQTENA